MKSVFARFFIKSLLPVIVSTCLPMVVHGQSVYGTFPYIQPFDADTIPGGVIPINIGVDAFTNDGLRLTKASNSQFGGVFFNNIKFRSSMGIRVEFEYDIYGGTGGDGFCMFLFNGNITTPEIGARGAALGYSYNRTAHNSRTSRRNGLTGAYLGVGFDNFGNFKNHFFQDSERRNGIRSAQYPSRGQSNVTLRGAEGGRISQYYDEYGLTAGRNGYPVLITQPTENAERGLKLAGEGDFTYINNYKTNFKIRGGVFKPGVGSAGYRKAIVELYPAGDNISYQIYVSIVHENMETVVIDNYLYGSSVKYKENALGNLSDLYEPMAWHRLDDTKTFVRELNTAIPEYLKIGFSASTGGENDNHLIRNVRVTLPGSAEAGDDFATIYSGDRAILNQVLSNDIAYNVIAKSAVGSTDLIDPESFCFITQNGENSSTPHYYVDEDQKGIWEYDKTTKSVIFTPTVNYTGIARVDYSIKARGEEPFTDDAYRSLPATIEVTVNPRPVIVVNRFLSPAFAN